MADIFQNGQGQMGRIPILTQAQKDEIERVQGMQVRTQAANIASLVLQHQRTSEARWLQFASCVEKYIKGELSADRLAPSLRGRVEAS